MLQAEYTSRNNDDRVRLSPDFKGKSDNRVPLSDIDQQVNVILQDTPGFKNETKSGGFEMPLPAERQTSRYINQMKNDLISDFNSTLNKLCSINSKSSSNTLPFRMNQVPTSSIGQKRSAAETNYRTDTLSMFSNREKMLAGKENVNAVFNKGHMSNFRTGVTNETFKDIEKFPKISADQIMPNSHRSGLYCTNLYRGILDPALKTVTSTNPKAEDMDSKCSNRFSTLVSDIQIDDYMFSHNAKPL